MGNKPSSFRTAELPLVSPSKPPQQHQLPKPIHRTVKYTLLLVFLLTCLYTFPLPRSTPSTPQGNISTSNHTTSPPAHPIIGKVTASFGPPSPIYSTALSSHTLHNTLHTYPSFTLHERLLPGLYSKHAYLLTILGLELSKPASSRLQWLFWSDRDTILMNPHIPLSLFLPPDEGFEHINLLVTRDRNGLNNGVFFVRVSGWAIKMFASALSVREYEPWVELKYTEQSAMEEVIRRPWWNSSVAYVPQRWFNGFPPTDKSNGSTHTARPGSLLIHFASNRDGLRPERMARWSEIAQSKRADWYKMVNETGYPAEIAEYWKRLGSGEDAESICESIGKKTWD